MGLLISEILKWLWMLLWILCVRVSRLVVLVLLWLVSASVCLVDSVVGLGRL